ncbi:WD repeat-containing protein 74 [Nowakowskiella sp. JEL0407]|nr:WD repeat-containing protein 74 [Nowakowskiella sp. JEL0407]
MPVRFYTGDEVGLVKVVTLIEPKPKPAAKKQKLEEKPKKIIPKTADVEIEPNANVTNWGSIQKSEAISDMTWGFADFADSKKQVVVGRQSGIVQYYHADNGSVLFEKKVFTPALTQNGKLKMNQHRKAEHFVGIQDASGKLITCTDTGSLRYTPVDSNNTGEIVKDLKQELLCRMKVHKANPNLVATGGDERDLCIWDVNSSSEKFEPKWAAKNIKHDVLDMRVPIWVTDIQWFDPVDPSKLVVGTGHHHIRLYDTRAARRPVLNLEIGELPVRSIAVIPGRQELIFSDTSGLLLHVDLRYPVGSTSSHPDNPSMTTKAAKTKDAKQYANAPTHGALLGSYRGSTGTVTSIHVGKSINAAGMLGEGIGMVTVGIDRMMRIFDVADSKNTKGMVRKENQKVYLKTRLTALLVDEDWDDGRSKGEDEQEDEDEMWDEMQSVKDEDSEHEEIAWDENQEEEEASEDDSDESEEESKSEESDAPPPPKKKGMVSKKNAQTKRIEKKSQKILNGRKRLR